MKFKKIATVLGSALMVGSTLGLAAAAAYPAPFVSNGVANVAIVVGTAGAEASDMVAATDIGADLAKDLSAQSVGGVKTVTGGDSVKLQRPSSFLHVGGVLNDVFGRAVSSADMPNLLADGTYRDSSNNDNSFTQKIGISTSLKLSQLDLSSYDNSVSDSTPVVGIPISSGDNVLSYTLNFQDHVNTSLMADTNLAMMGKTYYVLSASKTSITLLDAGVSASLAADGKTTLAVGNKSYDVSVAYIDNGNSNVNGRVKLTLNGETTDTLSVGDTYKLTDGSYVGIKDILSQGYSGGVSQVDFSIGTGKLTLQNNSAVKVNTDTFNAMTTTLNNATDGKLTSIVLNWTADSDTAITADKSLSMPVFDGVKLSLTGLTYPTKEMTAIKSDGDNAVQLSTVVKNGQVNLDILSNLGTATNFTLIGKDARNLLETNSSNVLTFNGTYSGNKFVASWANGKDAESFVLSANNFVDSDGNGLNKTTIISKDGGSLNQDVQEGDSLTLDNVVLTVGHIDKNAKTVVLTGNSGVVFNKVYTAGGLQILLPTALNSTLGTIYNVGNSMNGTVSSYPIQFVEEDKDGNIAGGSAFNLTVGSNVDFKTSVSGVATNANVSSAVELGNSNVFQSTVAGALASTIMVDKTDSNQHTATVEYHGSESFAAVYLSAPNAEVTTVGGASLGTVTVLDNEADKMTGKNLIVVGGNCVNSVAASLLGLSEGASCMADFTAKTGVANGSFLIQSFDKSGQVALLVAGYSATDTGKAKTYLIANGVDTTTGKKVTGTGVTAADVVIA